MTILHFKLVVIESIERNFLQWKLLTRSLKFHTPEWIRYVKFCRSFFWFVISAPKTSRYKLLAIFMRLKFRLTILDGTYDLRFVINKSLRVNFWPNSWGLNIRSTISSLKYLTINSSSASLITLGFKVFFYEQYLQYNNYSALLKLFTQLIPLSSSMYTVLVYKMAHQN